MLVIQEPYLDSWADAKELVMIIKRVMQMKLQESSNFSNKENENKPFQQKRWRKYLFR